MEKVNLFCRVEEIDFPFYVATFFLHNGKTVAGRFERSHFTGKNKLEVDLLETDGEQALVVLPKNKNGIDLALVKESHLIN